MKGKERIERFLELQNKNIKIDEIAKELGITVRTLKSFLNKNGYKLEDDKYVLNEGKKVDQITFVDISTEDKKTTKKINKKNSDYKNKAEVKNKQETKNKKEKINSKPTTKSTKSKVEDNKVKSNNTKSTKVKKDKKINLTQEDLDKLCEVYDWYLQVKDHKSIKPKKATTKKDVNVEDEKLKDLKNTSIRVDRNTWEDFERLCSNSKYTKQEIITQALKEFMKSYKHLL